MVTVNSTPASIVYGRHEANRCTVIRARSPLRISFLGGGTDLPHYFEQHGGAVLSSTINRYAFAELRQRTDDVVRLGSLDSGQSTEYRLAEAHEMSGGLFDLVTMAVRRIGTHAGFDLDVHSQAPRGSGLGGSSALTAAILGAIVEYVGMVLDPYEMAELNYAIERIDLGIAGGKQDQYATTFGGFNLIEFSKDRVDITPLRLPPAVLNDLENHLMLFYSGQPRPSLGLVQKRVEAYETGERSVREGMRRLHEMVYQAKDALFKGRLGEFGELLHANMMYKRQFDPHVSTPFIDELYDLARNNGAIGGKLLGAGGGGYLLILVEGRRQFDVRTALEKAGAVLTDFSFHEKGLDVWRSRCL